MATGHVEDQGEWERCRSPRRMFLALTDAGRAAQLREIALGLLRMSEKSMRKHPAVVAARKHWEEGLIDPSWPDKEQADRGYLVMIDVISAFNAHPNPTWVGGGEVVVCTAIRSMVPLAPTGFAKVGRREGGSTSPPTDSMLVPFRMTMVPGRSSSRGE